MSLTILCILHVLRTFLCAGFTISHSSFTEFEDFVFLPGIPYVFFAGSRAGTESCRDVLIVNDEIAELDEEFNVNLTPQTEAATVLDPTATITIEDDDRKDKWTHTHIHTQLLFTHTHTITHTHTHKHTHT